MSMLFTYISILGIWLALWVVFYGWGVLACRLSRCDRDDSEALLINPWIGLALVIGALQIWHFFLPVGTQACVFVSVVGILAFALFGIRKISQIGTIASRNWSSCITIGLLVLWLVNRSVNDQNYTDHGLYYLNSIRWISDYRIVPGLANLHNRFGFNNSIFLLHAMLEPLTGRGYSAHFVNGFMAAIAVPIIVTGLRSVFSHSAETRQIGWFGLGLGMIVIGSALDRRITSAHPDFPAALFVTIAAWRLLAMSAFASESQPRLVRWNLLAIGTMAGVAVTIKTTILFFAGFAGIVMVLCLFKMARERDSLPISSTVRQLLLPIAWAALFLLPWMASGYVLSGYPLFPSTLAGAPVDWRFDPNAAAQLREDIYVWARYAKVPDVYGPGWGWVPHWIVQVAILRGPIEVALPIAIAAVCFCWLVWKRLSSKTKDGADNAVHNLASYTGSLLAGAYFATVIAWFLTAPSPRMGAFACWGLAATMVGLVSRGISAEVMVRHRWLVLAGYAAMFVLPMADEALRVELRYRYVASLPEYGAHCYQYFPFILGPGNTSLSPVPKGDLQTQTTDSGLEVYLGKPTSDGKPGLVWDSPLPAARFFNPGLELRNPKNIQSGFKTPLYHREVKPAANTDK